MEVGAACSILEYHSNTWDVLSVENEEENETNNPIGNDYLFRDTFVCRYLC